MTSTCGSEVVREYCYGVSWKYQKWDSESIQHSLSALQACNSSLGTHQTKVASYMRNYLSYQVYGPYWSPCNYCSLGKHVSQSCDGEKYWRNDAPNETKCILNASNSSWRWWVTWRIDILEKHDWEENNWQAEVWEKRAEKKEKWHRVNPPLSEPLRSSSQNFCSDKRRIQIVKQCYSHEARYNAQQKAMYIRCSQI